MKKVFALVMAVMMVVGMLAGCNAANNPSKDNDKAGVIKVGTSGPLQGDYAVYGVAVANGLKLAFDKS
jgi:ABC-type branched-subunit amino acid transport system substrate-binding protein